MSLVQDTTPRDGLDWHGGLGRHEGPKHQASEGRFVFLVASSEGLEGMKVQNIKLERILSFSPSATV